MDTEHVHENGQIMYSSIDGFDLIILMIVKSNLKPKNPISDAAPETCQNFLNILLLCSRDLKKYILFSLIWY